MVGTSLGLQKLRSVSRGLWIMAKKDMVKNNKNVKGKGMAKKSRNKNHSNNFNIKFMPRLASSVFVTFA